MNYYVGHPLQVRGAEQYVLKGGKGDGMNFLYARNGLGLEIWISADRCADVARVTFNGKNMSYTSPCGQVAPAYYDRTGLNFLKSFNAGFLPPAVLTAQADLVLTRVKKSVFTAESAIPPLHLTLLMKAKKNLK